MEENIDTSKKTYVVDTSQEALEQEMEDAQGEVQTFLSPAIDDEPADTYEDLFGDYKHPEIMSISEIGFTLDGIKLMISKQGKYGRKIIDSLKKSMKQGKPVPPITVKKIWTKKFELISGRHRLLAALELGLTHLPVIKMYRRDKLNENNDNFSHYLTRSKFVEPHSGIKLMSLSESKKNKKDVDDEIHLPELSMKKKDLIKYLKDIYNIEIK